VRLDRSLLALTGLGLALTACSPIVEHRGYVADADKMAAIKPHVDTKESVKAALGTPSTVAPFDDSTWYYVSSITKHYAFQQPHTVARKVTEIRFDKDGTVASIDKLDLKDGQKVAMVGRTTPTKGGELTVFQQMFGNFGRLSKGGVVPDAPSRPNHVPGQGPTTGQSRY
jgi:outer membrane protein assembly factor BamE (lipoprotein component of BamABCDE complex)